MDYVSLARPLIGAVIGYLTNWIAVKMMFRPLKPIKIGKWTMPFTPGIIPKNKDRIAKSIGEVISKHLLTEEVLKKNLLSEDVKESIRKKLEEVLNELSENNETLENSICKIIDTNSYNNFTDYIVRALTNSILETIKESNVGELIANQIEESANEKIKGSMLSIFGANAIVSKISKEVSNKINEYIDENGNEIISNMTSKEITKISNYKVSELMHKIADSELNLTETSLKIYDKTILDKLPEMLKAIDISKIVTDKIDSMDMLELEKLILNIMKKELNALVNLGAIIGFALGLLNLLF